MDFVSSGFALVSVTDVPLRSISGGVWDWLEVDLKELLKDPMWLRMFEGLKKFFCVELKENFSSKFLLGGSPKVSSILLFIFGASILI